MFVQDWDHYVLRPNLEQTLKKFKPSRIRPSNKDEATNEEVTKWVNNYINARAGEPELINPCSFFAKKNSPGGKPYLNEFLQISGISRVRYFFGYEPTLPNYKFRLILAPVDSQGTNIDRDSNPFVGSGDLLQYSWPPQ